MGNTSMISVSVVEMRVNWTTDPHASFFLSLGLGSAIGASSFLSREWSRKQYISPTYVDMVKKLLDQSWNKVYERKG